MNDLFTHAAARARSTDPQTSRDAAATVDVGRDESLVIEALTRHGPMTTAEVAKALGRPRENISARFRPLQRLGLIDETGEKRNGSILWRVR